MSLLLYNPFLSSVALLLGLLTCELGKSVYPSHLPQTPPPKAPRPNLDLTGQSNLSALDSKERILLNTSVRDLSQGWLDLAGLGKVVDPPAFSAALQTFRQSWSAKNPSIAPFVGQWHDDASRGQIDSLTIFPGSTPNQVCILEFFPGLEAGLPDLSLPEVLIVSKATIINQQLLGSRLRSTPTALSRTRSFNGDIVEFLGVMDHHNRPKVFAASAPPKLPVNLPADTIPVIQQVLMTAGCPPVR